MRIIKMIADFGAQASSFMIQFLSRFIADELEHDASGEPGTARDKDRWKSRWKLPGSFRKQG